MSEDKALRFNEGKPRFSLIHYPSLIPMIRTLEYGESKYGKYNWKKPMNRVEILESLQRHLASLIEGESTENEKLLYDEETGVNHAGHIMANAMMYIYHLENNKNESNISN